MSARSMPPDTVSPMTYLVEAADGLDASANAEDAKAIEFEVAAAGRRELATKARAKAAEYRNAARVVAGGTPT